MPTISMTRVTRWQGFLSNSVFLSPCPCMQAHCTMRMHLCNMSKMRIHNAQCAMRMHLRNMSTGRFGWSSTRACLAHSSLQLRPGEQWTTLMYHFQICQNCHTWEEKLRSKSELRVVMIAILLRFYKPKLHTVRPDPYAERPGGRGM